MRIPHRGGGAIFGRVLGILVAREQARPPAAWSASVGLGRSAKDPTRHVGQPTDASVRGTRVPCARYDDARPCRCGQPAGSVNGLRTGKALLVMRPSAGREMVTVAQPQPVDSLRLVVDAETRP